MTVSLHSPNDGESGGLTPPKSPLFSSMIKRERVELMSETNPAPTTVPPADPPAPNTPPAPAPNPAPTPEPAPTANPSATPGSDFLTRLETVLQGLPERTANAVREVSPQHVPNPTANPQQQPNQPPVTPGDNPSGKTKGGPTRLAKWWTGMNE